MLNLISKTQRIVMNTRKHCNININNRNDICAKIQHFSTITRMEPPINIQNRSGICAKIQHFSTITRMEPPVKHLPSSQYFSRVVCVEHAEKLVYISGTGAGNDIGGPAREGNATEETRWSLENISKLLEASDSSLANVVSVTMLLTNKEDYNEINDEYVKHFPDGLPSRSTALWGVPTTAKVAFSCVAVVD